MTSSPLGKVQTSPPFQTTSSGPTRSRRRVSCSPQTATACPLCDQNPARYRRKWASGPTLSRDQWASTTAHPSEIPHPVSSPSAERWPAPPAPACIPPIPLAHSRWGPHAHRHQRVVVPCLRGRNNADVHMNVGETTSWNTFSNSPKVFLMCCSIADISSSV